MFVSSLLVFICSVASKLYFISVYVESYLALYLNFDSIVMKFDYTLLYNNRPGLISI
jgi:hypothetical protein